MLERNTKIQLGSVSERPPQTALGRGLPLVPSDWVLSLALSGRPFSSCRSGVWVLNIEAYGVFPKMSPRLGFLLNLTRVVAKKWRDCQDRSPDRRLNVKSTSLNMKKMFPKLSNNNNNNNIKII